MTSYTPPNTLSESHQSLKNEQNSHPEILLKKLEQLAKVLEIEVIEFLLWMEKYWALRTSTLLGFLHLAIAYRLDPLMGEVALWMDAEQQAHPNITIDGWMKIINQHPAFTGIEFEQTPTTEEPIPYSMQCTIYRSDRTTPIRVREYLDEVKSDHPLWKSMPRRMLRHRALQQCARLAFGISTPEFLTTECVPSNQMNHPSKVPSSGPKTSGLDINQPEGWNSISNQAIKVTRTEQLKAKLFESTKPRRLPR
jgi:hypothetical protein